MAKLIFLLDGNVIKEYAVDKERLTIGRRASNDVHIDNLAISGEHAEVVTTGSETYIQDLNSTNGTVVNKKSIKKHVLEHGDTIGLGKYQLKFATDAVGIKHQLDGFADTVLVEPEAVAVAEGATTEDAAVVPAAQEASEVQAEVMSNKDEAEGNTPSADALPPAVQSEEAASQEPPEPETLGPRLKILSGDNEGGTLLLDKSMVKVGQPGEQVAVITKRQNGYFVTHVSGDQHPRINGKSIGAQAYALGDHDELDVLGVKMEVCLD